MISIFNIPLYDGISSELENKLKDFLVEGQQVKITKINSEILTRSLFAPKFHDTLKEPGLNIVDGRGILWAAKYLTLSISKIPVIKHTQAIWQMVYSGLAVIFYPKFISYPISENIPGVEALTMMLGVARDTGSGVFFFGATQNDLDDALKSIRKNMPDLNITGSLNGYDWQNDKSIDPVVIINKTDAKLLIVALGSPLQEYWIGDNINKLKNIRVAVGEGGSLAFLAGTLKRAPKWMQKIGLEWLWRLFVNRSLTHQTGSRLKRVWYAVPVFIYEVVKWKLKHGKN